MGMLEVTCVPAIMEETLIREYTVNLPTSHSFSFNSLCVPQALERKGEETLIHQSINASWAFNGGSDCLLLEVVLAPVR